jgi:hypothetical protein
VLLLGVLAVVVIGVVVAARGVIEAHRERSNPSGRAPSSLDDDLRRLIGAESDGDALWDSGVGRPFGVYLEDRIAGDPTRLYELNLFPNYAFASAQDAADPAMVSHYEWRRGSLVAARVGLVHSSGPPTFTTDDVPWDVLPALVDDATERLGVTDPNARYVQIDNGLYGTGGMTLRVYVTGDQSRGGHVVADATGTIINVVVD